MPDLATAAAALGTTPLRVFLTTGRLGLAAFRAAPQHEYLVRTIDPPAPGDTRHDAARCWRDRPSRPRRKPS